MKNKKQLQSLCINNLLGFDIIESDIYLKIDVSQKNLQISKKEDLNIVQQLSQLHSKVGKEIN